MAIPYPTTKPTYVTVEKGDTLWGIAETYCNSGASYTQLARYNNLDNPNLIRVGQIIYLKDQQSQDTSKDTPERVTIKEFGLMSDADSIGAAGDTLFATWRFTRSNDTEHYQVQWKYKNIIEQFDVDETTTYTYSTYTINSKAKNYVIFRVKPIAKKDHRDCDLYQSTWTEWKKYSLVEKPDAPSAPNLSMSIDKEDGLKSKLTLTLNGLDKDVNLVRFEVYKDDTIKWKDNISATPTETGVAQVIIDVDAGYSYKAHCLIRKNVVESDWSPFNSEPVYSAPAKITKITECIPVSDTSIRLSWPKSGNATGYKVEYTANNSDNFNNNPSLVYDGSPEGTNTSVTIDSNISSGNTYYFRVKATRGELETEWSEIAQTTTESNVSPPTTWSSKTITTIGQDEYVNLYWVHNSTDETGQKFAEIEVTVEEGPDDVKSILDDLKIEIGSLDTETSIITATQTTVDNNPVYKLHINDNKSTTVTVYDSTTGWFSPENTVYTTFKRTINTLNNVTGWNGLIIGAKSASSDSLLPFEIGNIITDIKIDTSKSTTDMNSFLAKLTYVDGVCELLGGTRTVVENKTITFVINNSEDKKEKDKIHSVGLKISEDIYNDGAKIKWRIRTAGMTGVPGEEWSVIRVIDVYSKPELSFRLKDQNGNLLSNNTITAFPFIVNISLDTFNSNLHYPIGYHIIIKANQTYDTVDNIGNSKIVSEGEYVYSEYFDNPQYSKDFSVTLTPSDLSLESGYTYTIVGIVSMSSGVTSETSNECTVSWEGSAYSPNVEIKIDTDKYIAYLRPYCSKFVKTLVKVTYDGTEYTKNGETVNYVYGNPTSNTFTTTGERVFYTTDNNGRRTYYCEIEVGDGVEYFETLYVNGVYEKDLLSKINKNYIIGTPVSNAYTDDGELVYYGLADDENTYYCEVVTQTQITNLTLAVYRHENDGTFTEIMSGIDGEAYTYVIDPHPNLNYVKYRIIATDKSTGRISYSDTSSIPIGIKSIIIQWDEQFVKTDENGETDTTEQPWSGSLLKLPYNIDVSEKSDPEVSLIKYIGRNHPVSYYGTQLGITQTLNTVIEKDDLETINTLRRLQVWTGDVYIREPSGNGYWANIKVSFNRTHKEVTIPVSIDVTRVEGGI